MEKAILVITRNYIKKIHKKDYTSSDYIVRICMKKNYIEKGENYIREYTIDKNL